MYLFKVSKQLISKIVPEVAEALIDALQPYMTVPTTSEAWEKIAEEFNNRWNFPHCIGALDGKHVIVQAPINSGSEYFNYKGGFSIVLMALVDASYNFIYVHVGYKGGHSDGCVFKSTDLWQALEGNMLNIPKERPLPGRTMEIPYVIPADAAFPLQDNVMKPYPGQNEKGSIKRVFNYRLSRARRISENAFGILSAVFSVLRRPMLLQPKIVTSVTLACIYLHNFLRSSKSSNSNYTPLGSFDTENLRSGEIIPGSWRNENFSSSSFTNLGQIPRRGKARSNAIRDEFANFFVSPQGQVPWQDKYL